MKQDIRLPGGLCANRTRPHEPCILVDPEKGTARWSAYVGNVSWFAGSISVKLEVAQMANQSEERVFNESKRLEFIGKTWTLSGTAVNLDNSEIANSDNSTNLRSTDYDEAQDEGYILRYGYELFGIDTNVMPYDKVRIAAESNQSVWVTCHAREEGCDQVKLFEISQDFEGLVSLHFSTADVALSAGLTGRGGVLYDGKAW